MGAFVRKTVAVVLIIHCREELKEIVIPDKEKDIQMLRVQGSNTVHIRDGVATILRRKHVIIIYYFYYYYYFSRFRRNIFMCDRPSLLVLGCYFYHYYYSGNFDDYNIYKEKTILFKIHKCSELD